MPRTPAKQCAAKCFINLYLPASPISTRSIRAFHSNFKIARVLQIGEEPGLSWTPSEALLRLHA